MGAPNTETIEDHGTCCVWCVCLQEKATEAMVGDELFEPFSPDHSPSMFDIFDDDLAPPLPKRVRFLP